jgi:hypothetical protein
VIPKVAVDKIPVFLMAYGLSASADGNLFPWIFNAGNLLGWRISLYPPRGQRRG